jgi:hypothetical protein
MLVDAFPDRYKFECGSSHKKLLTMKKQNVGKYDLVMVDGDHSLKGAYNDILHTCHFTNDRTLLVMDDCELKCDPHTSKVPCQTPTKSFKRAVKGGLVEALNESKSMLDPESQNCYARYKSKCQGGKRINATNA